MKWDPTDGNWTEVKGKAKTPCGTFTNEFWNISEEDCTELVAGIWERIGRVLEVSDEALDLRSHGGL